MKEMEFLRFLIENLVMYTEDIKIEQTEDELWTLLTLSVHKDDVWIIIWKKWNTINSIRSILRLLWVKLNKKLNLKLLN